MPTPQCDGPSNPTTVALVNDYEIILQGLQAMLAPFSDRITVVEHEVGGTPDVCADIALFDTFPGRRDALDRAKQMAAESIVDRIVMYTWDAADEFVTIARNVGVSAIILKSVTGEALADQLTQVAAGSRVGLDEAMRSKRRGPAESLSLREQEVLALLALGYSNPEIANELFLSVDTVKTYVRRVFSKLGVSNRTNAALLAARYDLAPPARRLSRLPGGAEHEG
ncbi:MAG: response regulator transcription factor [Ilumatobacter sp.]